MKKIILDTHVFLWLKTQPEKVSKTVIDIYQNIDNEIFLSLVSVWEIQIKQQIGKLKLDVSIDKMIREQCAVNGLNILSINLSHILGLNELPLHHKDPFDRLLISQSKIENAILVSSDRYFSKYDVKIIW